MNNNNINNNNLGGWKGHSRSWTSPKDDLKVIEKMDTMPSIGYKVPYLKQISIPGKFALVTMINEHVLEKNRDWFARDKKDTNVENVVDTILQLRNRDPKFENRTILAFEDTELKPFTTSDQVEWPLDAVNCSIAKRAILLSTPLVDITKMNQNLNRNNNTLHKHNNNNNNVQQK